MVVGDSFLDVDVEGDATRLCPDAPVPVVDVTRRRHRPGGAGLAALLGSLDGADVVLITALGRDAEAAALAALWTDRLEVLPLPLTGTTVTKTRVIGRSAPLVRLDSGTGRAAPGPLPEAIRRVLRSAGAVVVSDYGRGVCGLDELRAELTSVAERVPLLWDPHPRGSAPVPGARLVTPNVAEAEHFSGIGEPDRAAARLADRWQADAVVVTVGAAGAVLVERGPSPASDHGNDQGSGQDHDRVHHRELVVSRTVPVPVELRGGRHASVDSCGAGDQFAVAAAAALCSGAAVPDAVREAVAAAARFVGRGAAGSVSTTVRPERPLGTGRTAAQDVDAFALADRVRRTGGRLVATGGCFDLIHPGHIALLEAARALGDALVVCLNSDDSVRRAKGHGKPLVGQQDRARVLTALSAVDAVVVFDEDTPEEILLALQPDVWVKGADYADRPLPEAGVVRAYGGQVRLVPLASGYSTTSIVRTAHRLSPVTATTDHVPEEIS